MERDEFQGTVFFGIVAVIFLVGLFIALTEAIKTVMEMF